MQAQLITGVIAAVGFLIVVIGAAMLASQFRSRQREGTAQRTTRRPGCVAWALIFLGGLIFVLAALTLAAVAK